MGEEGPPPLAPKLPRPCQHLHHDPEAQHDHRGDLHEAEEEAEDDERGDVRAGYSTGTPPSTPAIAPLAPIVGTVEPARSAAWVCAAATPASR